MDKSTELRHGRHCVFAMHVPLVFVTKYRRDVFTREILQELEAVFASVCRDFGATLVGFDGEDDPVHLLVNSPRPFLSLPWSTASRGFRAAGSGKNPFRTFARNSGEGISGPPPNFAGSCGGAPISVIRQYIEQHPIKSHYRDGSAVRAILPCRERQGLSRELIKRC